MSDYQYGYSGPPLIVVCRHCASKTEMTAASAIRLGSDGPWQVGCPSCFQPILETHCSTCEAMAAEGVNAPDGVFEFEDPRPASPAERAFRVLFAMQPGEISATHLHFWEQGYIECDLGDVPIPMIVDGSFDADQLEAIAAWLRDPLGVATAIPPPGVITGSAIQRWDHPDGRVYKILYNEAGEYVGVKLRGA